MILTLFHDRLFTCLLPYECFLLLDIIACILGLKSLVLYLDSHNFAFYTSFVAPYHLVCLYTLLVGNHKASNGRGHGQKQFKNISQSHPARLKKIGLFSQQASIHRTSFTSSYSKDRLCSDASSICSDISGAKTQN